MSVEYIEELITSSHDYETFKLVIETFDDLTLDDLKNFSIRIMKYNDNVISIFLNKTNEGVMILAMEESFSTTK
ncbi:hypothetical protein ES705_46887 [subsurface metagenome]